MTRFGAITTGTNVDPWTRRKDFLAAMGLLAEPWPNDASAGTAAVAANQQIHAAAVYLYNGETVTNIIVCVTTAASGAAPSLIKLGLWSSAATPACLAVTADLKSDSRWTSTGYKVCALSSPYAVTSSGIYYPVYLQNGAFGGTNVQFKLGASLASPGAAIGSNPQFGGTLGTGKTSMDVNDTGAYSTTTANLWIAVS